MQKTNAIIITAGYLDTSDGKTAHGLIRGTDRFHIVAVIDDKRVGEDAGEVLDGKKRHIPIYRSIEDFFKNGTEKATYAIIGVATKGGILPDSLRAILKNALEHGYSLVNGLHEHISEITEFANLAKLKGLEIIDIRKPKTLKDLHFWTGEIKTVKCPKVAVLGTDCALGKRTTTRLLTEAMRHEGYKAEMIYTGQTGWMQGAQYGFIFDSTLNDFISGEMEYAVVQCWKNTKPDIIFLEGQSSLRNPSGPAGAEWIISADANAVVLQHHPIREKYKGLEKYPATIANLKDEIELIRIYGAHTVAVTINTTRMTPQQVQTYVSAQEQELGIPVILPIEEGVQRLIPILKEMIEKAKTEETI